MTKILRSPIVVVALAVVAVGVLVWNVLAPQLNRRSGNRARAAASASARGADPAPATALAVGPVPTNGTANLPHRVMDRDAIIAQFPRWIESPVRDPFLVLAAMTPSTVVLTNKAADVLRLTAIWRQTGRQLAVINNQIVAEGEAVADFQIQRIDSEAVWVYRTNQAEKLDFGSVGGGQPP